MVLPNTAGKEMVFNANRLKKTVAAKQEDNSGMKIILNININYKFLNMSGCTLKETDSTIVTDCEELNRKGILDMYDSKGIMNVENNSNTDVCSSSDETLSPVLIRRSNPFSKQSSSNKSPSLLSASKSRRGRNLMRVRRTIINEDVITESKFFSKPIDESSNDIVTNDDMMLCSPTNSNEMLLEKENIRVEKTDKSNVSNLQTLMVYDEMEVELHSTDVDKFPSNEYQNTASNYDLGKSHFNVQIGEAISNKSSSEPYNSTTSLTSLEYDVDPDFLIQQDASALNSSLFRWSDTNLSTKLNSKTKQTKSESSSNSRTVSVITLSRTFY